MGLCAFVPFRIPHRGMESHMAPVRIRTKYLHNLGVPEQLEQRVIEDIPHFLSSRRLRMGQHETMRGRVSNSRYAFGSGRATYALRSLL